MLKTAQENLYDVFHVHRKEEVNNNNPDTQWSLYVDGQREGYGLPPSTCYNGIFASGSGVRVVVRSIGTKSAHTFTKCGINARLTSVSMM